MMDFYNKFIERRKDYFDIVAHLLSLYKITLDYIKNVQILMSL